jgi:hypothetical protein
MNELHFASGSVPHNDVVDVENRNFNGDSENPVGIGVVLLCRVSRLSGMRSKACCHSSKGVCMPR